LNTPWGEIGDTQDPASENWTNAIQVLRDIHQMGYQFRVSRFLSSCNIGTERFNPAKQKLEDIGSDMGNFPILECFCGKNEWVMVFHKIPQNIEYLRTLWYYPTFVLNLSNQGPAILWQRNKLADDFLKQLKKIHNDIRYDSNAGNRLCGLRNDFERFFLSTNVQSEKLDIEFLPELIRRTK